MSDERDLPAWLWQRAESDRFPPWLRRTNRAVLTIVEEFLRREVGMLGAAVAYYAFLSLVPLALLSVAIASFLGGGLVAEAVRSAIGNMLTSEGQAVIETALTSESGRGGATVISLGVLLWGSLRVFRGLDKAFSRVYGSTPGNILDQVRDGVVVLLGVGTGFVGMGLSGSLVSVLPLGPTFGVVSVLLVWGLLVAAFLPVYIVLPDAKVTVRHAVPGAILAAVSFTLLGTLFGVYTSIAGQYALYGVLGAVLLLLVWLNLISTAVIGGAVVNAVLAGKIGRTATGELGQADTGETEDEHEPAPKS